MGYRRAVCSFFFFFCLFKGQGVFKPSLVVRDNPAVHDELSVLEMACRSEPGSASEQNTDFGNILPLIVADPGARTFLVGLFLLSQLMS